MILYISDHLYKYCSIENKTYKENKRSLYDDSNRPLFTPPPKEKKQNSNTFQTKTISMDREGG